MSKFPYYLGAEANYTDALSQIQYSKQDLIEAEEVARTQLTTIREHALAQEIANTISNKMLLTSVEMLQAHLQNILQAINQHRNIIHRERKVIINITKISKKIKKLYAEDVYRFLKENRHEIIGDVIFTADSITWKENRWVYLNGETSKRAYTIEYDIPKNHLKATYSSNAYPLHSTLCKINPAGSNRENKKILLEILLPAIISSLGHNTCVGTETEERARSTIALMRGANNRIHRTRPQEPEAVPAPDIAIAPRGWAIPAPPPEIGWTQPTPPAPVHRNEWERPAPGIVNDMQITNAMRQALENTAMEVLTTRAGQGQVDEHTAQLINQAYYTPTEQLFTPDPAPAINMDYAQVEARNIVNTVRGPEQNLARGIVQNMIIHDEVYDTAQRNTPTTGE